MASFFFLYFSPSTRCWLRLKMPPLSIFSFAEEPLMEPCLTLRWGVFNQCYRPHSLYICVSVCHWKPEGEGFCWWPWWQWWWWWWWWWRCDGSGSAHMLSGLALPVFAERLSSVTGILGWIIRITLLLLKNTRSRGESSLRPTPATPPQHPPTYLTAPHPTPTNPPTPRRTVRLGEVKATPQRRAFRKTQNVSWPVLHWNHIGSV